MMHWDALISDKRLGLEQLHTERSHTRSDFQRDYDRMIFSSPFRRLQNKTQVFPLPGSVFVHNRLTHSLEVSSVGRSLANEVAMRLRDRYEKEDWSGKLDSLGDIVATSCLSHDIGNPPFGHSGEKTISSFFSEGAGGGYGLRERLTPQQWGDLIHFEGNANSLRVLTHQFQGRREGGFAMTYSALAAVVKYPHSSLLAGDKGKFGFFASEEATYRKIASELGIPELEPGRFARHPLTYIVEAADDICYQIMDIEDAHKLKILSTEEVTELLTGFFDDERKARAHRAIGYLDDPNEKVGYLRSNVIGALVRGCAEEFVARESQILSGDCPGTLIGNLPSRLSEAYDRCSETARTKIYRSPEVVDIEIAGNRIITYLMQALTEAAMHPTHHFSRLLLAKVPRQYDIQAEDVYTRLQGVLDHVSAMTDVYALDLYRRLTAHSLPAV